MRHMHFKKEFGLAPSADLGWKRWQWAHFASPLPGGSWKPLSPDCPRSWFLSTNISYKPRCLFMFHYFSFYHFYRRAQVPAGPMPGMRAKRCRSSWMPRPGHPRSSSLQKCYYYLLLTWSHVPVHATSCYVGNIWCSILGGFLQLASQNS